MLPLIIHVDAQSLTTNNSFIVGSYYFFIY